MEKRRKSPHDHGPSEIWERPAVYRTVAHKQRLVGARLRELRHQRGLTIEGAAEAAGIHPVHLQRIETGGTNATLATLTALALAYGVELAALFAPAPAAAKARKKKPVRYQTAASGGRPKKRPRKKSARKKGRRQSKG